MENKCYSAKFMYAFYMHQVLNNLPLTILEFAEVYWNT